MRELTILLAFSLTTAFGESPRLSIDSQTRSGNDTVVMLRNESHVPATSYTVGTSSQEFSSTDTLLGGRNGMPLLYGDTVEVRVRGGAGEARVMAAVFEDGITEGDRHAITQLLERRQAAYNDIPRALTLLRHAVDQHVDRHTAAGWFRQWVERYHSARGETSSVPLAAEMLLMNRQDRSVEAPARELVRVFDEVFSKLRESKPAL
jgi:hypothetical protein